MYVCTKIYICINTACGCINKLNFSVIKYHMAFIDIDSITETVTEGVYFATVLEYYFRFVLLLGYF